MMEIINLKAIPIVCERNVYSLNKKELNVVKKIKYRKPKQGFSLSKTSSLLENKTLAPLKKFIIEKAEEYTRNVLEINDKILRQIMFLFNLELWFQIFIENDNLKNPNLSLDKFI